jgi:tripartite ATP-independent transporter DctP family solute receptor
MYHYFALQFQEKLAEYSNGAMVVEIYPNAEYGTEREQLEAIQFGTAEAGVNTNAQFANFCKATAAIDLPFIFPNQKSAYACFDGPVMDPIFEDLKSVGFMPIAYAEAGFRHFVTKSKPIYKASDLSGLKMRVIESELFLDTYAAIGANAVPMAWQEVMGGLQQGTIDGLDIPFSIIYPSKFYDLAGYVSMSGLFYNALLLSFNLPFYNSLTPEEQATIQKAGIDAAHAQRQEAQRLEQEWIKQSEEKGMTVVKPEEIDMDSFRNNLESVYAKYSERIGGTIVDDLRKYAQDNA